MTVVSGMDLEDSKITESQFHLCRRHGPVWHGAFLELKLGSVGQEHPSPASGLTSEQRNPLVSVKTD